MQSMGNRQFHTPRYLCRLGSREQNREGAGVGVVERLLVQVLDVQRVCVKCHLGLVVPR